MKIMEARGDRSMVHFGDELIGDPDSKWKLFVHYVDDMNRPRMKQDQQGRVPKNGRIKLDLPIGNKYMLMAEGQDKAGMCHTGDRILTAPFLLKIDGPPSAKVLEERAAAIAQMAAQRPKLNLLGKAMRYIFTARGR